MITEIKTYDEFKECLKNNECVLVDCYADWCGPCRMLAPNVEKVSEEFTNIKFFKVNIDNINEVANEYQIFSIPTLLCIKNGTLLVKLVGFKNVQTLEVELGKVFSC